MTAQAASHRLWSSPRLRGTVLRRWQLPISIMTGSLISFLVQTATLISFMETGRGILDNPILLKKSVIILDFLIWWWATLIMMVTSTFSGSTDFKAMSILVMALH